MKVLSILLTLVNSLAAGLVLLSCMSVSNFRWEGLSWLGARIVTGILVLLSGAIIFRDGMQPIGPGKILMAGLVLILVGVSSAMWGVHLSIISGDVKNVMILFGGSLVVQGIASVIGLAQESNNEFA
jgi:hypothetical protein